ncbi:PH domain-containing protein [Helicobacter sp. 23-1045]
MAYSEKTNIDRMVYRAKISGWIYFLPTILIFFGLLLIFATNNSPSGYNLASIGALLFIVGLFILVRRFIYVRFTELYITQKFTIAKYGLIRRETIEMLNSKVESIRVNQGILGRILNYGNIIVVGAGGSSSPIRFIAEPLEFRQQLLYVQENNENTNKG